MARPVQVIKPVTGLTPHVVIFVHIKDFDTQVENILAKLEFMLGKQKMIEPLSLDQIGMAVWHGPHMSVMTNDIFAIQRWCRTTYFWCQI